MVTTKSNRIVPPPAEKRQANVREAVLDAAEELFAAHGFKSVSVRDIASAAGAHPGSVTYHFTSKMNLLQEIYRRHTGPMNFRRAELLREARRIREPRERVAALLRAFIVPAFAATGDGPGGGIRFTRLRAMLSAEGDPGIREIRAEAFDATNRLVIDALHEALPHLAREAIVWRTHFLLGSVYYTIVNPDRVTRLSDGKADGADAVAAVEALVAATMGGLMGAGPGETTGNV